MPPSRPLLHTIQSFRLGYNSGPQQPYPGCWTTLLIILFFSLLMGFLVCINVPLSAYVFVQEITFRPNDTVPDLLLSGWPPSILRTSNLVFAPQILNVGDTLRLDVSVLNLTIIGAFEGQTGNGSVPSIT
ncbi:hypothetical protein R3P38DRAFT_3218614 [Favolaschia claudopus]|uniref:Uncharacterized protein n=1 Tax=Favolaschia claudopus TaxID=2862362 RepID=A0AAW0A3F2_9AGAR